MYAMNGVTNLQERTISKELSCCVWQTEQDGHPNCDAWLHGLPCPSTLAFCLESQYHFHQHVRAPVFQEMQSVYTAPLLIVFCGWLADKVTGLPLALDAASPGRSVAYQAS